jgi:hypothetical protein
MMFSLCGTTYLFDALVRVNGLGVVATGAGYVNNPQKAITIQVIKKFRANTTNQQDEGNDVSNTGHSICHHLPLALHISLRIPDLDSEL